MFQDTYQGRTQIPLSQSLAQLPRQYFRVITKPSATTFTQEMGKASWGSVWIQLLGLACFSGLIVALLGLLGLVVGGTTLSPLALSFGVLGVALIASLLVVVLFFLLTGFFYLCAKRAGGQGTFLVQSYTTLLFLVPGGMIAEVLTLLTGFVPILGWVFLLTWLMYSAVLEILVIKAVHGLSGGKSSAVVLLPPVVAIVIAGMSVSSLAGATHSDPYELLGEITGALVAAFLVIMLILSLIKRSDASAGKQAQTNPYQQPYQNSTQYPGNVSPLPYPQQPWQPSPTPPGPQARRSLPLSIIILSSLIVLLFIAGSGLIYYATTVQPALFHAQATATAQARFQKTAQANATSTAQALATAQAVANATATAQALATSQAVATATARQAIYSQATQGTPAFNDPLSGPNVNNWDTGTDSNGNSCAFTGGAYHISELQQNNSLFCLAEGSNFGNFAFQVQMAITGGDGGGIVFRASSTGVKDYAFLLYQEGTYDLVVNLDSTHSRLLKSGFSPIINTGLNRSNELTIVARGNRFYLYVNKQYLANVSDSTYASGAIGLAASDLTKATDVAFQSAQVWTLS